MNKDDYALFKYSIIAPFINGTSGYKSARGFSSEASKKEYTFKGILIALSQQLFVIG